MVYLWAVIFMSLVLAISDIKEKVIFTRHVYILAGIGIFYNLIYTILNLKDTTVTWLNNSFINSVEGLLLGAGVLLLYFVIAGLLAGGKMAMGDGDIYIAGALGACIGFEKVVYMLIFAFIIQILITFIMFEYSLYKAKDFKMFTSIIIFIIMGIGYCLLDRSGIFLNSMAFLLCYTILWIAVSLYILRDTFMRVWSLKEKSPDAVLENFICVPFGPALVVSGIGCLFYFTEISTFIQKFININLIG